MTDSRKFLERLESVPGRRSGQPCIRGTRITVFDVLSYLASSMSVDDLLADFPDLQREDVQACLAYAASREGAVVRVAA
jgi:uncharacterized protein (DUF433 family)